MSTCGSAAGGGEKAPALTMPQARLRLQATLPRRPRDAATLLALLAYV